MGPSLLRLRGPLPYCQPSKGNGHIVFAMTIGCRRRRQWLQWRSWLRRQVVLQHAFASALLRTAPSDDGARRVGLTCVPLLVLGDKAGGALFETACSSVIDAFAAQCIGVGSHSAALAAVGACLVAQGAVQQRGLTPTAHDRPTVHSSEGGVDEAPGFWDGFCFQQSATIDIRWPTLGG